MENEFVDIPQFEGRYKVNKIGQIFSLGFNLRHRNGKYYWREGRQLKPILNNHGYYMVRLSNKDGKLIFISIHRIVALAFIPNPQNKTSVNHKNGIKTDNCAENLEWATPKENNQHAWNTGLQVPKYGKDHHLYGKRGPNAGKKGEELAFTKIILDTQTGIFYYGANEAANAKGLNINNLKGMMAGFIKNNTGLIYA